MREGGVPVTEKHPIGGGGGHKYIGDSTIKWQTLRRRKPSRNLVTTPLRSVPAILQVCMRGVCSQSLGHSRRWLLCPFKPWGTNIDDLRILIICFSPVHAVLCCQDKGSSQHWFQQHQKLQALVTIKNHQHSFWQSVPAIIALSCILMMHSTTSLTILICEQAVIKHSHI